MKCEQFLPIIGSHDHDREIFDFPGLNQSERFEKLVECAGAAGHHNERVGVLNQQRLAGEEIMHPHTTIEINVGWLLGRQLDRTSDRASAGFFGASVCRFHDARAAASDDRETKPRNGSAHFSG